MSKYYRELAPNELGGHPDDLHFDGRAFRPIEVDDIPEYQQLEKTYRLLLRHSNEQDPDRWHPASDPPKPEDFLPTGYIERWHRGARYPDICNPTEWKIRKNAGDCWRKITPPCQ